MMVVLRDCVLAYVVNWKGSYVIATGLKGSQPFNYAYVIAP